MGTYLHADESTTDPIGRRSFAGWVSRSLDAIRADLKFADCGSLDVLLYCPDAVAGRAPGDLEVDRQLAGAGVLDA